MSHANSSVFSAVASPTEESSIRFLLYCCFSSSWDASGFGSAGKLDVVNKEPAAILVEGGITDDDSLGVASQDTVELEEVLQMSSKLAMADDVDAPS